MTLEISPLTDPNILETINNAGIPQVNAIDLAKATWLLAHASLARLAVLDGKPAGMLVVFDAHCGLDSEYYAWFTGRYRNFYYIDRVVVLDWARRQGIARALYCEVDALALAQQTAIAAEVYSQPANLPSLQFHASFGFQPVGEQFCAHEGKTVAKLMKYAAWAQPLEQAGPA